VKGSGRTGRRPGTSRSREKILSAARKEFSAHGYGATIERIARRAGCDSALVHHYFGTKAKLFDEAMELPGQISEQMPQVLSDTTRVGENLARLLLESRETERSRQIILGLLRSALANEEAAGRVRELIVRQAIAPALDALSASDTELRSSLIGAHIIGIFIARQVVHLEPLASMPIEDIVHAIAPTLQNYLFGDIGGFTSLPQVSGERIRQAD